MDGTTEKGVERQDTVMYTLDPRGCSHRGVLDLALTSTRKKHIGV